MDAAVVDNLAPDGLDHIDWNCKTDADVAPAGREDRGIDADEFAAQVDQWSAGITRIDRRIGLDEVFIALDAQAAAPERADNTGGDRLAESERVADCHHEVTDP